MATTPPKQQRVSIQEIRKAELIAATKACLATRGLGETTLRRVADQAQTTASSVVYHFKSKEALILGAVADTADELRHEVEREVAGELTATEKLARLVRLSLTATGSGETRWRLWLEIRSHAARDSYVKKTYLEKYEAWLAVVDRILQEGVAAGEFSEAGVGVAPMVSAVIDGVAFYLLINPETDREAAAEWCTATLLAAVAEPRDGGVPTMPSDISAQSGAQQD
jgi:AcrR family transcriptional regulator